MNRNLNFNNEDEEEKLKTKKVEDKKQKDKKTKQEVKKCTSQNKRIVDKQHSFQFMKWKMFTNFELLLLFVFLFCWIVPFFFAIGNAWCKRECRTKKKHTQLFVVARKQCFYSNCYSVAHSWHYFLTLIKFHPNHNSSHVGALLQSLSNAHYHHIHTLTHTDIDDTKNQVVIMFCTNEKKRTHILTFLTFLWHSQKPIPYIYFIWYYIYKNLGRRRRRPFFVLRNV